MKHQYHLSKSIQHTQHCGKLDAIRGYINILSVPTEQEPKVVIGTIMIGPKYWAYENLQNNHVAYTFRNLHSIFTKIILTA